MALNKDICSADLSLGEATQVLTTLPPTLLLPSHEFLELRTKFTFELFSLLALPGEAAKKMCNQSHE